MVHVSLRKIKICEFAREQLKTRLDRTLVTLERRRSRRRGDEGRRKVTKGSGRKRRQMEKEEERRGKKTTKNIPEIRGRLSHSFSPE